MAGTLCSVLWCDFAHATTIRGIHSLAADDVTRVVIDLSGATRFQYGSVPAADDKPARVYVDVHDVVLEDQKGQTITFNDPRVQRVRTGQHKAEVVRIVLELNGTAASKVTGLDDPPRIVIELSSPGAAATNAATAASSAQASQRSSGTEASAAATQTAQRSSAADTRNATLNAPASAVSATQPSQRSSVDPRTAMATRSSASNNAPTPARMERPQAKEPISHSSVASAHGQPGPVELPVTPGRGTGIAPASKGTPPPGSTVVAARSTRSSGQTVSMGSVPPSPAQPRPSGAPVGAPVTPGRGTGMRVLPPTPHGSAMAAGATRAARPIRIVIDPGHGGKDPGAKSEEGGAEKDSVLDIARRLAAKLRGELNVEVHMTRGDDTYVPLDKRKDLANRLEADMFVSIHANASRNSKLYGIETYYLKNTNDRATLRLARLENGVDMLIKGSDVSTDADLNYILSDIIQGQKEADSVLLANHIQSQLCGHLQKNFDSIRSLGVKQGPFLVLDGTYMPAVLVETGFITNGSEGRRLRAAAYQESVAEGVYRGIKAYLEDNRVNDLI